MIHFFLTITFVFTSLFAPLATVKDSASEMRNNLDSVVTALHEKGQFNGVILLAKKDEIIYKKALGKANFEWDISNTIDTRFRIASITKTFTAALILRLIEENKLRLDDVITDYLTDYPSATGDMITIEQLLVQSAGIPDYLGLPNFMEKNAVLDHNRFEFPNYFKNLKLEFKPGTEWDYGNSGYYLLGLISEKVTGMPYELAMKEYILDPGGVAHTGFATTEKVVKNFADGYVRKENGYEHPPFIHSSVCFSAGMMYSTAEDLFKWMRALYKKKLILSEKFLEFMTTEKKEHYGCGIFIGQQNVNRELRPVYVHLGEIHGYSAQASYFPENEYTVIILDNTQQDTSRIYFAIRDILPGFSKTETRIRKET